MTVMKPGYVPPPSVGHEIGVMFGFIGAFLLATICYFITWTFGLKRSARIERERREKLASQGIGTYKGNQIGIGGFDGFDGTHGTNGTSNGTNGFRGDGAAENGFGGASEKIGVERAAVGEKGTGAMGREKDLGDEGIVPAGPVVRDVEVVA
ncbi:MAG: hypothetical protein M1819_000629 [Sarea resinae]|nr:MAG: hypothetical protein M1819_000629 [Sarea resinae]